MARTVRVHDTSGALVLDLSTDGYEVVAVVPQARSWRRMVATSPYVDGSLETGAVLDAGTVELTVRCVATDHITVDDLYRGLLAAVEVPAYLLMIVLDGAAETYAARPADTSSSLTTPELLHFYRTVSLSVPVQPLEF